MTEARLVSLCRLLQLASPTLPVGGYTYSQGLEWAVASGTIHDEASAGRWIGELLDLVMSSFEAPMLVRLMAAWRRDDQEAVRELDAWFLASRETAELRLETLQMGYSLARLMEELGGCEPDRLERLRRVPQPTYPCTWAWAAAAWRVPVDEAVCAYLWAWAENQVLAAIKTVPLGQTAGQRLLHGLGSRINAVLRRSLQMDDESLSNLAPAFAIASCRHETQYSRLFRS